MFEEKDGFHFGRLKFEVSIQHHTRAVRLAVGYDSGGFHAEDVKQAHKRALLVGWSGKACLKKVQLCTDLNEGRGEPPCLGKSVPSEGTAGAKALSLVGTWHVGGTAQTLKSEINREQSLSISERLSALSVNVLFLLEIFSKAPVLSEIIYKIEI